MKKRLFGLSFTAISITAISLSYALINKNKDFVSNVKADNEYTLTINNGVSVNDGEGIVKSARGTDFTFGFTSYSAGTGKLGTLSQNGTIYNKTLLNSIQRISVNISSGSVDVFYGWKQYSTSEIEYNSTSSLTVSSGTQTVDLSSIDPSYFKVVANTNSVINSITVVYTCSEASYVPNLRLKVASPTVGGSGQINDSNYVWICTNIEDSSATDWPSYAMTKDGNDWHYDFTNIAVATGGYGYTFVVCDSNTSIDWSYQTETQYFGVGAGQTLLMVSDVNFDNQPAAIQSTYTLNLTINTSGTPSNFGNIQFVFNYTNSTSTYSWGHEISNSWQSSYSYSYEGLDSSSILYFKIYMWSNSQNLYVGNGDSNFSINPTGSTSINATVTFTYSASSPITGTCTVSGEPSGTMSFNDQTTTVYGEKITITPTFSGSTETFTASYSGENIRIDDNLYITGLKAGTTTQVTLTSYSGLTCSFNVTVSNSTYTETSTRDGLTVNNNKFSQTEGWFNSTTVGEISGMGSDFFNGMDVSSAKALYDNGTKFYNANGVEQSLFYILKDAGVNWIRLKLWVDPQSTNGISYGGGESNLENTLWMAYEAKAAGMKFLLDFHYSDYWTHPGQQIIPKAWNSCNSASSLQAKIKSYTTEVLTSFKNAGCLPDMVQLGNEISSGIYLQKYSGGNESLDSYGQPSYLTGKSNYSYGTSDHSQYTNYIKAASEGVDAVDSSIKKVLHWAKGSSISASTINSFFANMPNSYYDYAAISFYPYYCFDSMSNASSILNGLSLSKPWFVAETSYPFTGSSYVYENGADVTNFTISSWNTGDTNISSSYAFTPYGQAHLIHDLTSAVVSAGGKGIFYWEPAWVPNASVGWAGAGSLCTWSNQGFFSYDGKAIANLDLFAQMSLYI